MIRLCVLASGEGTNLEAVQAAIEAGRLDARVALVVCDSPGAGVLRRAAARGIPARLVERRAFRQREAYERAILAAVGEAGGADLTLLAGYMRVAGPLLLQALWPLVNLHPSLLPSFPGLDAVGQALRAGVRVTGCTVHFLERGVDSGPIIAQRAVAVRQGDDAGRLLARVHRAEHRLVPETLALFAAGRVRLEGRRVRILSAAAAARAAPPLWTGPPASAEAEGSSWRGR